MCPGQNPKTKGGGNTERNSVSWEREPREARCTKGKPEKAGQRKIIRGGVLSEKTPYLEERNCLLWFPEERAFFPPREVLLVGKNHPAA